MAHVIIFLGLVLCGQTVAILFLSQHKYPAEFFPMMLGIPTLFIGVVALNPHRRYLSAWFLGTLATFSGLLAIGRSLVLLRRWSLDLPINSFAWAMVATNAALCVVLVLVCMAMAKMSSSRAKRRISMLANERFSATPIPERKIDAKLVLSPNKEKANSVPHESTVEQDTVSAN